MTTHAYNQTSCADGTYKYEGLLAASRDNYVRLALRIVNDPAILRILDMANQDYDGFIQMLANKLRAEHLLELPLSIQEALNSGDGSYRP